MKTKALGEDKQSSRGAILICRKAFEQIHGLSATKNKRIHKEISTGRTTCREVTDRDAGDGVAIKSMMANAEWVMTKDGLKKQTIDSTEAALAALPNSFKYKKAFDWLTEFIQTSACHEPNGKRLTLERQTKKEIYNTYQNSIEFCEESNENILGRSQFMKLFKLFPQVSIRKYKTVSGKCSNCVTLTQLRGEFTSPQGRKAIAKLHAYHRVTYMAERKEYYRRCALAETDPDKYMSIIIDGMAQNHTQLPYLANVKDFGDKKLDMHLEGVIEHGYSFTMYRTFNNVTADSNLIIHVILKQIEKRLQRYPRKEGVAAPTLFLQVDGGPENANKYVLALCEYLVARDIFSTIYLTRLPVGHTHEDIDARFGVLWRAIRDKTVITPKEYEEIMHKAFSSEGMKFYLEDIFAVPDYKLFFRPFVDATISGYTKLSQTQLCFRFERFEDDRINFPLCVRTMYRSYCTDKVYEIIEEKNNPLIPIGQIASEVYSKWGPLAADSINDTNVDGIYVLKALPYDQLVPAKFEENFLSAFKGTLAKARTMFRQFTDTVKEWDDFATQYPNVETSFEYVLQPTAQYELPMKDNLFGYIEDIDAQYPFHNNYNRELPSTFSTQVHGTVDPASRRFVATHAIRWHNRGRTQRALPNRLSVQNDPSDPNHAVDLEAALIQQTSNVAVEEDALNVLNINGLKAYCRMHGITGFSGLKKNLLVAHIIAHRRNQSNASTTPANPNNATNNDGAIQPNNTRTQAQRSTSNNRRRTTNTAAPSNSSNQPVTTSESNNATNNDGAIQPNNTRTQAQRSTSNNRKQSNNRNTNNRIVAQSNNINNNNSSNDERVQAMTVAMINNL